MLVLLPPSASLLSLPVCMSAHPRQLYIIAQDGLLDGYSNETCLHNKEQVAQSLRVSIIRTSEGMTM